MLIKIILALVHIGFSVVFDVSEYKMPLYVLSAILTMIGIYNSNKEFGFLLYTFITFVNTFIKGFFLEMYLHNRHSLLDPKTLKLAFYVFIITIVLGNPFVIKRISSFLDSHYTLKFGLNLSDKVSQCITLSNCYHHVLSQPNPSMVELAVITTVGFSITNLVIYFGLLESKSQVESIKIMRQSTIDNFITYSFAIANVYAWNFHLKPQLSVQSNNVNDIRTVVSVSFIVIYTLLSMLHSKHQKKEKKE
ncbi:unnamed protein product (macronuclear) [Paramecium tetraurelia]|uniref:Uncharacterized protein n=1 Tax=Paramecium tetraurelia TaxID=5888 RepID=A0CBN3_PARTE|nr:uncharacterized protein GSPATT00036983001 [Paramecium tetraurelia]CAK68200.1 unnamed protein product [Paramecium tetraurelia]|eukprot:XP_001435597.1 hypothetical protein (macronuclear) [Paramecium tetraurelia strain d4-2]